MLQLPEVVAENRSKRLELVLRQLREIVEHQPGDCLAARRCGQGTWIGVIARGAGQRVADVDVFGGNADLITALLREAVRQQRGYETVRLADHEQRADDRLLVGRR